MDDMNLLNSSAGLISADADGSADDFFTQFINKADTMSVGLISEDALDSMNDQGMLIAANEDEKKSANALKLASAKEKVQSKLKNIDDKTQALTGESLNSNIPDKPDASQITQVTNNAVAAAMNNQAVPKPQLTAKSPVQPVSKEVKKDRKPVKIKNLEPVQIYADEYVANFKKAFDVDLIPSIVYENMNKLMHPETQGQNCYFMCNTYRLSTFMYIMDLLVPWVYSTMMLNTVSGSNLKTYKDIVGREIDIHAKSNSDALLDLYKKRYIDRINSSDLRTDSVLITLGVNDLPEIYLNKIKNSISDISGNYAKNHDMKFRTSMPKLSAEDIDNLKYVHSNFWYMLQLFEYNIEGKRDSMIRIALKMINTFGK